MTQIFTPSSLPLVREILKKGGVVSFPTETVYGLGADVQQPKAVSHVFHIKERPSNHPVIVHIDTPEKVKHIASEIPDSFWDLSKAFWPGPLTLILKKHPQIADEVTGGHHTVAIRIPNHPLTLELLSDFEWGLIGPSANRFGQISPTKAEHVINGLGDDIDGVLDGGQSRVGIESTVIQLIDNEAHILRKGMISEVDIGSAFPDIKVKLPEHTQTAAPGTHKSHYAPRTKLLLVKPSELHDAIAHHQQHQQKVVGFGVSNTESIDWVQMSSRPSFYAHQLYDVLHHCDAMQADLMICELPDEQKGEWGAIMDRLKRAAAK